MSEKDDYDLLTPERRGEVGSLTVQVLFDEKQIFELCDETFKEGKIGLWTKSNAVTYFDDLTLHILD